MILYTRCTGYRSTGVLIDNQNAETCIFFKKLIKKA